MSSFWDALANTAKSVGGAVTAPLGFVADSAKFVVTAPFDDDDDSLGDFVNMSAGYANKMFDPVFNSQTITGKAAGKVFEGAEFVYREGISEPAVTFNTVMGRVGNVEGGFADVFDKETWAQAYKVAQNRSIGQSNVVTSEAQQGGMDPLDRRAYRVAHERNPFRTSMQSGAVDFAMRWYADPLVVGGKLAAAGKAARSLRKITYKDRQAGLGHLMDTEVTKKIGVGPFGYNSKTAGLKTRTEEYLNWIGDKSAEQIRIGSPELDRSPVGRQVAGLLAEANKISDPVDRLNAQKRILRVHNGDMDEVFKVEEELSDLKVINDGLKNLAAGNTLEVDASALGRYVFDRPEHFAKIENQLTNIPETATWLERNQKMLESVLDVKAASNVTVRHSTAGERRLRREMGETKPRILQEKLGRLLEEGTHGSVFQKSLLHPPVYLSKKLFVDAPLGSFDALRTSKLQGVVNLHDLNGMATQMDSMMRYGKLTPAERFDLQGRLSVARTETEKMKVLAATEERTMMGMARHYAAKTGEDIDADFIRDLMRQQGLDRGSMLSSLQGRAYSAAQMRGAQDAKAIESAIGGAGRDAEWRRVDLFDDDGIPIAMPLLETQAANIVPLLDFAQIEKSMKREFSYLSRLSRSWRAQRTELDRLSQVKAAGGNVSEKMLNGYRASMDFTTQAAATAMRAWKFSVLFRLGYPIRVLGDEHMRIWSQIGALGLYGPSLNEGVRNFGYNVMGRRGDRRKQALEMRQRIAEIDSILGDEVVQARRMETLNEIKSLNRRLGQRESDIRRADEIGEELPEFEFSEIHHRAERARGEIDGLRDRRDMLQELLDVDPEDLMREREALASALDNYKAMLPAKRKVGDAGSKPLVGKKWRAELPGGYSIDDAFAGPMGNAARKASSSNESYAMELQDTAHRNYQAVTGGSWRTIMPEERGHLDAWQWAANKHIRQSRAAMHFIKGGTIDEFVEWATRDPEGIGIARRVAHFAHDPEQWAHRVKAMVDEYVPTEEMRTALRNGEVNVNWLRNHFRDVNDRPDVHGGILEANLETGSTAQTLHNWMMKAYQAISDKPTDQLARHPFFAALYRREVDELRRSYVEAGKRTGRTFKQEDADEIAKLARRNALHDVRRFLFDISTHSNAAHTLRFISPFFAAHQESLGRWWRIVSDDPSVIARFQQGFDAPRKLGLVVDENGDPVESGKMVSDDHYLLVRVPRAWLTKEQRKNNALSTDWDINESSFNIVLQGGLLNPGVGPLVQMPVEKALEQYADQKDLEKLAATLNPYRPDAWYDPAIPATARRVVSAMRGERSEEFRSLYAQNIEDQTVAFMQAHGGRPPNQDEADRIMVQAKRKTQTQALLRVAQNFFSPAPAHPRSRYEAIRAGWRSIQDQARQAGKPYEWAEQKFIERYGEAMAFLTESTSNNVAGLDSTQETVAYMKKHRGLLDQIDPRLHGFVISGIGEGAYSQAASSYLSRTSVRPGVTETYFSKDEPREGLTKALASRGWEDYSKAMAGLNATAFGWGYTSYLDSPELQEQKSRLVAALAERNPHWYAEYSSFDSNDYERLVNDMRNVANARSLRGDTARGDVQALRAYVGLRDQMTAMLAQRDAMGGSADMTAVSNTDLAQVYRQHVSALVESNTWFEEYMFNGTIERDPYLAVS